MSSRIGPLLFAAALDAAGLVQATDLGTIGPVYPIGEPHLLDFIRQRLPVWERSGELKKLEQQARTRGVDAVADPKPVAGIELAQTPRTFYFDPTFTLERNVFDDKGSLLFASGTRKNPLEVVSLSKHLLFFDARDQRQVTRARELIAFYRDRNAKAGSLAAASSLGAGGRGEAAPTTGACPPKKSVDTNNNPHRPASGVGRSTGRLTCGFPPPPPFFPPPPPPNPPPPRAGV